MSVQDFSYETDVAPYAATRFFTGLQQDTALSPEARERLQSGFFKEASDIEAQRLKLSQERTHSALQQAQLASSMSALEESRLRRKRILDSEADDVGIDQQINATVYSDDDPDTRRQNLANLALKHSGKFGINPTLSHRFKAAEDAIPKAPKPMFTPEQQVGLVTKLANHPEGARILASQDPVMIGVGLAEVEKQESAHKAAMAELTKDTEDARRMRHGLLFTEPDFVDDVASGTKNVWLKDGVHNKFKLLMSTYGTPEEQKQFTSEKDDHKRADMAVRVQHRELQRQYNPAKSAPKVDVRGLVR